MTTISNAESGASVRAKLNAALAITDKLSASALDFTPEQYYDVSDGGNWLPAFRAAIAAATAAGGGVVRATSDYELWQPAKPSGTPDPFGGVMLTITANVALIGRPGGSRLTLCGPTGAPRAVASYGAGGTDTWYGGFVVYLGTGVTESVIHDLIVDGNTDVANVYANTESNVYDKGIWFNDFLAPNIVKIDHTNCEFFDFAGEIWYMGGGYAACKVRVQNLWLHHSPQSAWNAGTVARVTAINLEAGDSYQAGESIMGAGHDYYGGRFYNPTLGSSAVFIGTEYFGGGAYNTIYRNDPSSAWTTFHGTLFDRVSPILQSYVRGNIILVDGTALVQGSHIKLEVDYLLDQNNNSSTADIQNSAQAVDITVNVSRTQKAISTGHYCDGVGIYDGTYVDGGVRFTLKGGPYRNFWGLSGISASPFYVPLVAIKDALAISSPYGGASDSPAAPGAVAAFKVGASARTYYLGSAGTYTHGGLDNTYDYAEGQEFVFYHGGGNGGAADRLLYIAKNATGLRLNSDCTLRRLGERLILRWDTYANLWIEAARVEQGP